MSFGSFFKALGRGVAGAATGGLSEIGFQSVDALKASRAQKKRQKLAQLARQAEQPVVVQAAAPAAAPARGLSTNTVVLILAAIGLAFALSSKPSRR